MLSQVVFLCLLAPVPDATGEPPPPPSMVHFTPAPSPPPAAPRPPSSLSSAPPRAEVRIACVATFEGRAGVRAGKAAIPAVPAGPSWPCLPYGRTLAPEPAAGAGSARRRVATPS